MCIYKKLLSQLAATFKLYIILHICYFREGGLELLFPRNQIEKRPGEVCSVDEHYNLMGGRLAKNLQVFKGFKWKRNNHIL